MTYPDQWKVLSSRIRGLMQAGQLYASFLSVQSNDSLGAGRRLREQSEAVLQAVESFRDRFQPSLSPAAVTTIKNFVEKTKDLTSDTPATPDVRQQRVWAALVQIAAFETEMSFILSDVQESIRARSERAFSHLQRLIVVDSAFREKWQEAFKQGEVACEKLGAVHLLLHGIWAFKVDASGGRTDLVFQEPAGDLASEQRYVDGFVLTEWKKASSDGEGPKAFEEARSQARNYAQGVLGGSELTGYRYAVVVSRRQVGTPDDMREGEVIYRHINVAVEPAAPSRTR